MEQVALQHARRSLETAEQLLEQRRAVEGGVVLQLVEALVRAVAPQRRELAEWHRVLAARAAVLLAEGDVALPRRSAEPPLSPPLSVGAPHSAPELMAPQELLHWMHVSQESQQQEADARRKLEEFRRAASKERDYLSTEAEMKTSMLLKQRQQTNKIERNLSDHKRLLSLAQDEIRSLKERVAIVSQEARDVNAELLRVQKESTGSAKLLQHEISTLRAENASLKTRLGEETLAKDMFDEKCRELQREALRASDQLALSMHEESMHVRRRPGDTIDAIALSLHQRLGLGGGGGGGGAGGGSVNSSRLSDPPLSGLGSALGARGGARAGSDFQTRFVEERRIRVGLEKEVGELRQEVARLQRQSVEVVAEQRGAVDERVEALELELINAHQRMQAAQGKFDAEWMARIAVEGKLRELELELQEAQAAHTAIQRLNKQRIDILSSENENLKEQLLISAKEQQEMRRLQAVLEAAAMGHGHGHGSGWANGGGHRGSGARRDAERAPAPVVGAASRAAPSPPAAASGAPVAAGGALRTAEEASERDEMVSKWIDASPTLANLDERSRPAGQGAAGQLLARSLRATATSETGATLGSGPALSDLGSVPASGSVGGGDLADDLASLDDGRTASRDDAATGGEHAAARSSVAYVALDDELTGSEEDEGSHAAALGRGGSGSGSNHRQGGNDHHGDVGDVGDDDDDDDDAESDGGESGVARNGGRASEPVHAAASPTLSASAKKRLRRRQKRAQQGDAAVKSPEQARLSVSSASGSPATSALPNPHVAPADTFAALTPVEARRLAQAAGSVHSRLSQDELQLVGKQFKAFSEAHGRGQAMSIARFQQCLAAWQFGSEIDVSLAKVFDRDRSRSIDLEEFVGAISVLLHGGFREKLRLWFDSLDLDRNGRLDASEVRHLIFAVSAHTGDQLLAEASHALAVLDKDNDGRVTFAEFQSGALKDASLRSTFQRIFGGKK